MPIPLSSITTCFLVSLTFTKIWRDVSAKSFIRCFSKASELLERSSLRNTSLSVYRLFATMFRSFLVSALNYLVSECCLLVEDVEKEKQRERINREAGPVGLRRTRVGADLRALVNSLANILNYNLVEVIALTKRLNIGSCRPLRYPTFHPFELFLCYGSAILFLIIRFHNRWIVKPRDIANQ